MHSLDEECKIENKLGFVWTRVKFHVLAGARI